MRDPGRPERLKRVYEARSSEELAEIYDGWAEDYEKDVLAYGYTTPAVVAALVGRHVPPGEGTVLDAGVGAGMMGTILAPIGYDLAGIDLSPKMLDLALAKGVYRSLDRMELGKPLDFPDGAYAATISAGVFTAGHAPPDSFDELVRVTKSGGCVIFSVRDDVYRDGGFEGKLETLEAGGGWTLAEESLPYVQLPLADPDLKARVFVCRVR